MHLTQKENVDPICPHCDKHFREIWFKTLSGFLGKRYVYFCPECQKVIGVSHRKGFWMG